jgi:hypothetical protein
MNSNSDKEYWIDAIMDSTRDLTRVQPGKQLYAQIMLQINNQPSLKPVRLPVKQLVAAAILLVVVNAASVVYYSSQNKKAGNMAAVQPFALQIQTESTYNY